jgi:AcrR family transcriptional regulator
MATTRAERTLATRRRMVRAAYDQFCAQGYTGATVASIAHAAGVAVPTIYYTFGTKAALFAEALGAAVLGFADWRQPPPDPEIRELLPRHGWWVDFQVAPTSDAALEIFLVNGARTLERVGALSPALQGAASDPEGAEVVRVAEHRRQQAYREALRAIAALPGGLREGLTLSGATDILMVLFSSDVYQALRAGRGWSAARCTEFLVELVKGQLLEPSLKGPERSGIR